MHAVAVEFDLVQPVIAFRRRVDQLGELARDPIRQGRRACGTRYRPRHAGGGNGSLRRRMHLLKVINLADMPGGMGELEPDAIERRSHSRGRNERSSPLKGGSRVPPSSPRTPPR